jgi:hypothetical protein
MSSTAALTNPACGQRARRPVGRAVLQLALVDHRTRHSDTGQTPTRGASDGTVGSGRDDHRGGAHGRTPLEHDSRLAADREGKTGRGDARIGQLRCKRAVD